MATNFCKPAPDSLLGRLFVAPLDLASLAAFRILFGAMMAAAMVRFLAKGWVTLYYVEPRFYFCYPGFGWVHPWPPIWMHIHYILLALLAVGVAVGYFYRICIALFFLGFVYVELIDQTAYLNHYYLISLLSGLMIFLPANRCWSLDAWRKPAIRADGAPAWCLNILRFQVGVVYIFAGLAKFNADWLFRAEPLQIWLAARSDLPLVGSWLNQAWVAYAASWFGALFDTSIVFFLLCKRTRKPAYVLVVFFHVATWVLFHIGMFPWIMIVAATLFFPPDWPRHWLRKIATLAPRLPSARRLLVALALPERRHVAAWRADAIVLLPLALYAIIQLTLPVRYWFEPRSPAWTGIGFNCTWHVMIAEKTGFAEFYAFNPSTGRQRPISVNDILTPRQETLMAKKPYLIRQMACYLAADLRRRGFPDVQIRVNAYAALDGRPSQPLINPDIDLATATGTGWIVPLNQSAGHPLWRHLIERHFNF
jgi:vitamin K-dependent gamma-carboxylase